MCLSFLEVSATFVFRAADDRQHCHCLLVVLRRILLGFYVGIQYDPNEKMTLLIYLFAFGVACLVCGRAAPRIKQQAKQRSLSGTAVDCFLVGVCSALFYVYEPSITLYYCIQLSRLPSNESSTASTHSFAMATYFRNLPHD